MMTEYGTRLYHFAPIGQVGSQLALPLHAGHPSISMVLQSCGKTRSESASAGSALAPIVSR
jgi:hypothetical protein